MAKYTLKVPLLNPQAPPTIPQLEFFWAPYYRTNDPDAFMLMIKEFMENCFPCKFTIADDLTLPEVEYFVKQFNAVVKEAKVALATKGYPLPNINEIKSEDLYVPKTKKS
jgi:hypothetical protein